MIGKNYPHLIRAKCAQSPSTEGCSYDCKISNKIWLALTIIPVDCNPKWHVRWSCALLFYTLFYVCFVFFCCLIFHLCMESRHSLIDSTDSRNCWWEKEREREFVSVQVKNLRLTLLFHCIQCHKMLWAIDWLELYNKL